MEQGSLHCSLWAKSYHCQLLFKKKKKKKGGEAVIKLYWKLPVHFIAELNSQDRAENIQYRPLSECFDQCYNKEMIAKMTLYRGGWPNGSPCSLCGVSQNVTERIHLNNWNPQLPKKVDWGHRRYWASSGCKVPQEPGHILHGIQIFYFHTSHCSLS